MADYNSAYTGAQIDAALGKANTAIQPVTNGTLTLSTLSVSTSQNVLVLRNTADTSVDTGVGVAFQPNDTPSRQASIRSVQEFSGNWADLRFFTAGADTPAERARFTGTGTFLVAKTTSGIDTAGFEVSPLGRMRSTVSNRIALELNLLDSDGQIVSFSRQNLTVGSIIVTASGTTYATTSDERLKTVLGPAENSGEVIDAIKVVRHVWNATGQEVDFGLIAQQLHRVFPAAVVVPVDEETPWQIDLTRTLPLVIAELKHLRARVAELEKA